MLLARTAAVPVRLLLLLLLLLVMAATASTMQYVVEHNNNNSAAAASATTTATAAVDHHHRNRLRDGQPFPLVGCGAGNLPPELVVDAVAEAWQLGYRLFDTAHASKNAHLIVRGLRKAQKEAQQRELQQQQRRQHHHLRTNPNEEAAATTTTTADGNDDSVVHIVTKIWYTHLGYERTRLALEEIRRDYSHRRGDFLATIATAVHLHVLVHWPRCRDDGSVPWMRCREEEDNLPPEVKEAGPPPHRNPDAAFLGSWRALEEAYFHDKNNNSNNNNSNSSSVIVSSIGVSNFDLRDLQLLEEAATVLPHVLQDNVWNAIFHPDQVLDYCRQHSIQYQAYNVMNGIVGQRNRAPKAWRAIVADVDGSSSSGGGSGSSSSSSGAVRILQWLTQTVGVAVVPRTAHHLAENAPSNVLLPPPQQRRLPDEQTMVRAVQALLRGRDDEDGYGDGVDGSDPPAGSSRRRRQRQRPEAVFVNRRSDSKAVHIYWRNHRSGEEVPVRLDLMPGESHVETTDAGHTFVVYDESASDPDDSDKRQEYQVQGSAGRETFHIEL